MLSPLEENTSRKYDEIPSATLIELHFGHSRRRATRRHNEHVLRSARRRQRLSKLPILGSRLGARR